VLYPEAEYLGLLSGTLITPKAKKHC